MNRLLLTVFICLFITGSSYAGESMSLAAGVCINKAQKLYDAGDLKGAVNALESFRAEASGQDHEIHYHIHFLLGNYYLSLADNKGQNSEGERSFIRKAANCYQDCLNVNKTFNPAWLNLAKCRYELGAYDKAAHAFEQGYAASKTPKAVNLYYAAVCRFQADQPDKALKLFNRILSSHPGDVTFSWKETLVNILFSMGKFKQALPHIQALTLQNDRQKAVKWQEILLHQYLSLGMKKKALEYAQMLVSQDPLEPKWWKALCHIHLDRNRPVKGLTCLIIYGYLVPLTLEEQKLAADLYLTLDIPDKALEIFEQIQVELTQPNQIIKAGQAALIAHEPDKALAWLEKGLLISRNPEILQMKARILYTRKAYDKAADVYEKVLLLHRERKVKLKNIGQTWLMLGFSAMNAGFSQRAEKAFIQALKYKKQKKSARAALDGLAKISQTKKK